jgi:SAM-dependent methyltransferase
MEESGADREHWSRVAAQWIAWARAPNHDAFWAYRDSLADYIGRSEGEALDVGCGEGRVSRLLKSRGYRVTAVDPVPELVKAAEEAESAHAYTVAPAGKLPFEDGSFDLVVAYNMLMDVVDVPGAVRELRRVLRPSGTLFVSIVHPLADMLLLNKPGEEASPESSYFQRRWFDAKEERNGLSMHFSGWAQPLEAYASALENAGLAITSLREPVPELRQGQDYLKRWTRLPLFLWFKARPLAT